METLTSASKRRSWGALFAVSLLLGSATAVLIARRSEDISLRTSAPVAEAAAVGAAVGDASSGSPDISWTSLPTSLFTPLVADGTSAWYAVVEQIEADGSFTSGLYEFVEKSGTIEPRTKFSGRPTALARVGHETIVGVGNGLLAAGEDGSIRRIELPATGLPTDRGYVTAIASNGISLYIARDGLTTILEVGLDGVLRRELALPPKMAAPTTLIALQGDRLLASTPFGTLGGLVPGSAEVNMATGEARSIDLAHPFSFARSGAALVTTQSVPGGGLERFEGLVNGDAAVRTSIPSKIPWNGKWDILAIGPDESLWGAVSGEASLFHELAGMLTRYELPQIHIVPSIPPGTKGDDVPTVAIRTIDSLIALDDGTVVFLSASPGGALGFITQK